MVYNLWLVESEDMEPSDTEDHGTFFFLTVVLEWRGEVIFHCHSGNRVPFKSVSYSRVCRHLF